MTRTARQGWPPSSLQFDVFLYTASAIFCASLSLDPVRVTSSSISSKSLACRSNSSLTARPMLVCVLVRDPRQLLELVVLVLHQVSLKLEDAAVVRSTVASVSRVSPSS